VNKMSLRLLLMRGNDVLWEMPLFTDGWPKDDLDEELEGLETEFDSLSEVFDALSHKNRLMIMKSLLEEGPTLNFSALMRELNMNPKMVRESTRKLREGGLLRQPERGKYECSRAGQASFLTLTLTLKHLLRALENEGS